MSTAESDIKNHLEQVVFFALNIEASEIFSAPKNKTPHRVSDEGFWNLILTMTYSHMGKPHTTIGDA
ncbi:hypothetical protein, partial [Pseudomonas viridiflava]|uniref:hypothetical protein n=1 Tax=Pseudomonas viridiflava TaxID=33069 RepID=UPI00197B41FF